MALSNSFTRGHFAAARIRKRSSTKQFDREYAVEQLDETPVVEFFRNGFVYRVSSIPALTFFLPRDGKLAEDMSGEYKT